MRRTDQLLVAVVDTGVDYNHPDLEGSIYHNARPDRAPGGEYGARFITPKNRSATLRDDMSMDDNGHGTHVTGTIAATGNNRMGGVGVAWQGQILPVKAFDQQGNGNLSDVIEAITYACEQQAQIVNMSFSFGPFDQPNPPDFDLLKTLIEVTYKDVLFVTCAGNADDGVTPNDNDAKPIFPAAFRLNNLITVMAVDRRGDVPRYSNYGKTTVDVAAPGGSASGQLEDILSTDLYTNQPDRNLWYRWKAGTSMATAHVTGMAALIWANDPRLKAKDVKDKLVQTVSTDSRLQRWCKTGGLVQLDLSAPSGAGIPAPGEAAPATPSPRPANPLPPPPGTDNGPGCGPGEPENSEASLPESAQQEPVPPPANPPLTARPAVTGGATEAEPGESSDLTPGPDSREQRTRDRSEHSRAAHEASGGRGSA